ncbi:hypothetical protein ACJDU8_04475 [Clostridium sp. WILCCON 0269]|uniref:Helix-turn-helix type 11 domain-containing protein n=1 Tax=Candidatus Clostridium eludens TaxID=3381663 RepID=A0ABW8SGE2_9CLOT
MKRKMTDKHKFMSYVLNNDEDLNVSTTKIAEMFEVSQSTVSNAIKDVRYELKIKNLEKELSIAKKEIYNSKIIELPENTENITVFKRKP